jgi:O-antigen/teichoic acid export membrane protein
MTCYGLAQVAYALQLALGLTRFALVQNLALLSLLLPLIYLLSVHASMQAVAGGMLAIQFLSLTLGLTLFHRHLATKNTI